jgi:beta-ring hydroxylase
MCRSSQQSPIQQNPIMLLFHMALAAVAVYSGLIHLESIYYGHLDLDERPLYKIPIISELSDEETLLLFVTVIFLLVTYVIRQMNELKLVKLNMPVVPCTLPFLGTAFQFLTNTPWDLMESWHRKYGSIYTFKLLGRTCVSIEKPEHLKIILQSKIQNVKKDVHFAYKPFLCILGGGIVTSEGESWMYQRRKISGALKVDILETIPGATLGAVQRLMSKLDRCAENGSSIDIAEELRHLTLQVISETFLSLDAQESDTNFATMYLPIVEEGNKRVWSPERQYMFFMPSFWKHIFGIQRLNAYVSKLITDRWALRNIENKKGSNGDILDKVLDHFEKENPGRSLCSRSVRQLRDEFKTFMLAGHETSAAMMTWTFFELMRRDEIKRMIEQETADVFGVKDWKNGKGMSGNLLNRNDLPSREELSKLILSEACLKESLRLYSVVPVVMRQISKPVQVENHIIPKNTSVTINIQSVHHNETYWPNPMHYDPSRFTQSKIPDPYTFIPFIDGPRNCLGQYLALLESKMVIALITQRYDFKLINPDFAREGCDPRHRYIVPISPKDSLDVTVSKKILA